MDESFSREEKLKSKILIGQLFSEGKSVNSFPVKLIYIPIQHPDIKNNKVGVSVPKRNFKLAVKRNRLKRLLREAYRKNKYLLPNNKGFYALMFIYTGKKPEDYTELNLTMEKLLQKFIEKENIS